MIQKYFERSLLFSMIRPNARGAIFTSACAEWEKAIQKASVFASFVMISGSSARQASQDWSPRPRAGSSWRNETGLNTEILTVSVMESSPDGTRARLVVHPIFAENQSARPDEVITVAAACIDGVKGSKCAAENAPCKGAYSQKQSGCRMWPRSCSRDVIAGMRKNFGDVTHIKGSALDVQRAGVSLSRLRGDPRNFSFEHFTNAQNTAMKAERGG